MEEFEDGVSSHFVSVITLKSHKTLIGRYNISCVSCLHLLTSFFTQAFPRSSLHIFFIVVLIVLGTVGVLVISLFYPSTQKSVKQLVKAVLLILPLFGLLSLMRFVCSLYFLFQKEA